MGDHYIPRHYLNGFVGSDNCLSVYDKRSGNCFRTQTSRVAHENGFYTPDKERYLATEIEGPTVQIINKIKEQQPLTKQDKNLFTKYLVTMWKRVPHTKNQLIIKAPSICQELENEIIPLLEEEIKKSPENISFLEKREKEIKQILQEFSVNPPKEAWEYNINPNTAPNILKIIEHFMTWAFLICVEGNNQFFITSDNPVFIFESLGLNKDHSEISFPISKNITLWLTWNRDIQDCNYYYISGQTVKEINNRTISRATRFVYATKEESTILRNLNNSNLQLNILNLRLL
ncbi:MAG: DUF4238 domain-containing protein [Spirochaetota bacterium]|nr:DUF4238 domain-containing protein [Spirochaetota bacterium]